MHLTLQQAADWLLLQGLAVEMRGEGTTLIESVVTDSRQLPQNCLFVALRGANFDGHGYATASLQAGAAAVLVERSAWQAEMHTALVVEDSLLALGKLAAAWREFCAIPVVAITGSNGKTSVKEMLASILRHAVGDSAVLATSGNLNNHIGLPLTLLRLRATHRYAVVEMGMNHFGEIAYLTQLAQPNVALVNNAQAAHLEALGSVAGVAQAKGEIFSGLSATGIAIWNAADTQAPIWQDLAASHTSLTFGQQGASVWADAVQITAAGSQFILHTPQGTQTIALTLLGAHNVQNAQAAASAALALGFSLTDIAAGLATCTGAKGRLQRKAGWLGARIIDDTYNANPDSVRAAIAVLQAEQGQRILVLGDLGELGGHPVQQLAELGCLAQQAGIDALYTVGELAAEASQAFGAGAYHFQSQADLIAGLRPVLNPETVVLVKGSRFMQMERVVMGLLANSGMASV